MTVPDVVTATETAEAAAASTQTNVEARTLAGIIAKGMATEAPPTALPGEAEAAVAETSTDATVPPEDLPPTPSELDEMLQSVGVDLGVSYSEVPAELQPAFVRMAEQAISLKEQALERDVAAAAAQADVKQFRETIEKNPQLLLLTIAVQNPAVFQKATEVFAEMNQDPRYKDLVLRELETEVKSREIGRREFEVKQLDTERRAARVEAEARRQSRRLGVPFELVEQMVAAEIGRTGGQFDAANVEPIVQKLRAVVPRAKPTVTPAQLAAAKGAPTQPAGTTAAPSAKPTSPGLVPGTMEKMGGGLRAIVRQAAQRVANATRENQ